MKRFLQWWKGQPVLGISLLAALVSMCDASLGRVLDLFDEKDLQPGCADPAVLSDAHGGRTAQHRRV